MFAQLGYYICVPFAWLTRLFYSLTGSYGLALILFTLVVQGLTVSMVVQAVTLFASLLHGGVNPGFFPRWIQLAGQCFPAALILQVFYIGPLVRWLFRLLFRRNEKAAARN